MVEHLPSMHETLDSILNLSPKRRRMRRKKKKKRKEKNPKKQAKHNK